MSLMPVDPHAWPCPGCGARPHVRCQSVSGHLSPIHAPRLEMAQPRVARNAVLRADA